MSAPPIGSPLKAALPRPPGSPGKPKQSTGGYTLHTYMKGLGILILSVTAMRGLTLWKHHHEVKEHDKQVSPAKVHLENRYKSQKAVPLQGSGGMGRQRHKLAGSVEQLLNTINVQSALPTGGRKRRPVQAPVAVADATLAPAPVKQARRRHHRPSPVTRGLKPPPPLLVPPPPPPPPLPPVPLEGNTAATFQRAVVGLATGMTSVAGAGGDAEAEELGQDEMENARQYLRELSAESDSDALDRLRGLSREVAAEYLAQNPIAPKTPVQLANVLPPPPSRAEKIRQRRIARAKQRGEKPDPADLVSLVAGAPPMQPPPPPLELPLMPLSNAVESRCFFPNPNELPNRPIISAKGAYEVGGAYVNHIRTVGEVDQAFFDGLPASDPLQNKRYPSCAVVASAGIMRLRKFGAMIDSHDAVFRFNTAFTKGLEEHVGSKTTIRLVNRENFGFRESAEEIVMQHITTETMMLEFAMHRTRYPTEEFYAIDPAFYLRVVSKENPHPTNGYFGIKLALELCDCVYLYGFVRQWKGYMTYHYHDDYTPRRSQKARDNSEYPLIKELLVENLGRLVFTHPCITDPRCEGCPEAGQCTRRMPYPAPKPGFCYGHGPPGGAPGLHHWVAREYFSSLGGAAKDPNPKAKGKGAHGKDKAHGDKDKGHHSLLRRSLLDAPPGNSSHTGGGGGGGGRRRLLSHAGMTPLQITRLKARQAAIDAKEEEEWGKMLNTQNPALPYGDGRRSCFRRCLEGEVCKGGAGGVCSEATARANPCLPWRDVSPRLQIYEGTIPFPGRKITYNPPV